MHATPARRLGAIGPILIIAFVLSACGQGAGGAQSLPEGAAEDRGGDGGGQAAPGAGGDEERVPVAALVERRIVKDGELEIQVADVAQAVTFVRSLAVDLGGYVGDSQASEAGGGATLTLRIPADRFDDALEQLRSMDGEVVNETTSEEDVTTAIVDLEARIENLRSSEATYRELLDRATSIDDVLAVQRRLDDVRGEIEQLDAQRVALEGQADLSTLTVRLVPQPVDIATGGWDPGRTVEYSFAALLALGQALVTLLIVVALVLVPILVVIGIGALVVFRVAAVVRRRFPARPAAET